jgi:SPP1 family predicted phage head-tail adaptor
MRAGDLNRRVTLQTATETQDGAGQPIPAWSDVATVWAAVEPLEGRELFAAQQINAEAIVMVRIRYRPGVRPKMRVLYGSRLLGIISVIDPGERHEELRLLCSEVVT